MGSNLPCVCEFNYSSPKTPYTICKQRLWFNSHLKSPNNKFYIDNTIREAGIYLLEDVYDKLSRQFKSYVSLVQEFETNSFSFVSYHRLVASIPRQWKKILQKGKQYEFETNSEAKDNLEYVCENVKITKTLTKEFTSRIAYDDKIIYCGNQMLNVELNETTWSKIRKENYYVTLYTKLRYFQYRLFSNKLVTKSDVANGTKL